MFRARSTSSKRDFSTSLTQNISSYLACGPLKRPEVMSSLLGRPVVPVPTNVNSPHPYIGHEGYELVVVYPYTRRNPIFVPNPANHSLISFALYNDLTKHELRLLAMYNGIGVITEASLETSAFGNRSIKHLIHRLREGIPSTQYYFPTEDEVFDKFEMEHLPVGDYVKEAKLFNRHFSRTLRKVEGSTLPSSSRR